MRAGVVDEHVDAAEFLLRCREDASAVLGLADVGGDADDLALFGERGAGLVQHIPCQPQSGVRQRMGAVSPRPFEGPGQPDVDLPVPIP